MLQAWKSMTLESVALFEKKNLDKHWYQNLGAKKKKQPDTLPWSRGKWKYVVDACLIISGNLTF